jgi:hypothetical protein
VNDTGSRPAVFTNAVPAQASEPIALMTDGAESLLRLKALLPIRTRFVLDYFHVSMKLRHTDQCIDVIPPTALSPDGSIFELHDRFNYLRGYLWSGRRAKFEQSVELSEWGPHLELVDQTLGQVLSEPSSKLTHVSFPTSCIVSLLYVTGENDSAEIAVVGHEGIVGVSLFMGGETTPSRAVVQSSGRALRLKGSVMMKEFNCAGPVMHLLHRYSRALITQMSQTAVATAITPSINSYNLLPIYPEWTFSWMVPQRGFEPLTHALRIRRSSARPISINMLRTPKAVYAFRRRSISACAGTKVATAKASCAAS